MSEKKNLGHNSKKDFLKSPVEHIDITSFDSRKIISSMKKMSFVSRETANASEVSLVHMVLHLEQNLMVSSLMKFMKLKIIQ